MLVLTRKLGERISIGQDVEIVVLRVSGNRVRLGIAAPPHVPIRRDDASARTDDKPVEALESGIGSDQPAGLCVGV